MFEITKPITSCGIGYDKIPKEILNSEILSANDLGKLGGIEQLPDETQVNEYKLIELSDLFVELEDNQKQLEISLHKKAKVLLKENLLVEAWLTLLAFND